MEQPRRIIRPSSVCHRTGLSRTTLWRRERKGTFPQRVKLNEDGSAVGYYEDEIDQWVRDLIRGTGRPVRQTVSPADDQGINDDE
jgi:prophage regulatory protein